MDTQSLQDPHPAEGPASKPLVPFPDFGADEKALSRIALVGCPNVGKTALFNALTGRYATVSNYPGTTVEVVRGQAVLDGKRMEIIDTPGLYSLLPLSGEEQVARRILLGGVSAAAHVVDAKNLERMLPLTLQLIELGLPVVLVLNMMDEAEQQGIRIDAGALSRALGVPVLESVSTTGRGLDEIRKVLPHLTEPANQNGEIHRYRPAIETALDRIEAIQPQPSPPGARGMGLLLLQEDPELTVATNRDHPRDAARLAEAVRSGGDSDGKTPAFAIAMERQAFARKLASRVMEIATIPATPFQRLTAAIDDLTTHPITGIPILLAVLYFGLYKFVGEFGAGEVVNYLEGQVFGKWVHPWVNTALNGAIPGDAAWRYWLRELVGGEYGIVTLGITYAVAIVLPIVSLFFLFFSLMEDSGYFPRLAMLVDRLFKGIGLNGRAVIPIVLGFGCDTMGTMVTRIQETRRERVITTFLLALAIPCSAQYGLIIGLLARLSPGSLGVSLPFLIWGGIMLLIFLAAGRLLSRILPGKGADFYMELPPMRIPRPYNVILKTFSRMKWYFMEILPLFILASLLIWAGRLTRVFDVLIAGLEPLVGMIGLPPAAAEAFLYGFFRRDFGAAGLFHLANEGQLNTAQLLVASVTLTLFLPCVAQLLMMKKELGARTTFLMSVAIFGTAFLVGGTVHHVLSSTGYSP